MAASAYFSRICFINSDPNQDTLADINPLIQPFCFMKSQKKQQLT
ncbi:hypothetical protein [[Phormidium ambiguum] IAM M-71]|nr:hypothetical protein [Phormidium ambiguum]